MLLQFYKEGAAVPRLLARYCCSLLLAGACCGYQYRCGDWFRALLQILSQCFPFWLYHILKGYTLFLPLYSRTVGSSRFDSSHLSLDFQNIFMKLRLPPECVLYRCELIVFVVAIILACSAVVSCFCRAVLSNSCKHPSCDQCNCSSQLFTAWSDAAVWHMIKHLLRMSGEQ